LVSQQENGFSENSMLVIVYVHCVQDQLNFNNFSDLFFQIQDLVNDLNIQINNLCQFLPQVTSVSDTFILTLSIAKS
jgi:hypothetical protein